MQISIKKPSKSIKLNSLQAVQEKFAKLKNHPFADFNATKIVFGKGNIDSPLLFLGEGPGREEDLAGEPFVGRAGKLLTTMIESIGLKRNQVYITNVIKCRLPNNRRPKPEEINQEKSLILNDELSILAPKIICTLGSSATQALLGHEIQISQARGKIFKLGQCLIMPTYHPAYLLRKPAAKPLVWLDLQQIANYL